MSHDRPSAAPASAAAILIAAAALASAGALFGLAGVFKVGRPGWVALGTGALVLALALASGVSALLI